MCRLILILLCGLTALVAEPVLAKQKQKPPTEQQQADAQKTIVVVSGRSPLERF